MLEAVIFGQKSYQEVIKAIIFLAQKAAKDPWILDKLEKLKNKILLKLNICQFY